jgi:AraC-like DNA-binding protein
VAYAEVPPPAALRPFVDRFWTRTPGAGPGRILPDGCIDLIVSAEGADVVGTMTRPFVVPPGPGGTVVAVRFRPGGAAPFLRVAAHELTDRRVSARDLHLAAPAEPTLAALARFLLERLPRGPEPRLAHAVRALLGEAPPSVSALADELGWSRQHLGRRFRDEVGVGPKELARVARVQRAVDRLQRRRGTVAAAAAELGYFDQAHLAHDFRALVGLAPAEVQAGAGSIFPIRSLLDGA